jgi:hypothetical protein
MRHFDDFIYWNNAGAEVAALTPQRLAEWIGRILK